MGVIEDMEKNTLAPRANGMLATFQHSTKLYNLCQACPNLFSMDH